MKKAFGFAALLLPLLVAGQARQAHAQQRMMEPPKIREAEDADLRLNGIPEDQVPRISRPAETLVLGGFSPAERMQVGVGLFVVPKTATANFQEVRVNPAKDPTGKTSRIAAVGMSLRF
jgi:hypothetical protein